MAFFEAFKGAVVLLAASGLLSLIHKDVHAVAAAFIDHMHLNPASRYPQIFLDATLNLAGLLRRPTWHGTAFLAINVVVVALMVGALVQRRTRADRNAA